MHYLSHYTEAKTTEALDEAGAFFAFGQKQLEEKRVEGIEYVSMGAGLICPKDNARTLREAIDDAVADGIAADLAENGEKAIIHRELSNHEYSYTLDIWDTSRALVGYGITNEEILAETGSFMKAHLDWEEAQEAIA